MSSISSPREEWINAVYGKEFYASTPYVPPSSGEGLAKSGKFTIYNAAVHRSGFSSKVGLCLADIKLGLYVSKVYRHSEAEYAGIIPGSVLVEINGASVLCEKSEHALEHVWRVEHWSGNVMGLAMPVKEMKFIFCGEMYTVHLFSKDFGMEWDSSGSFTIVMRAPDGVRKGSLLLSFDNLNFRDTLTHMFASSIAKADATELKLRFGFTPPTSRFSSSPKKYSTIANLACVNVNVNVSSNQALIDNISSDERAKQLKLTAHLYMNKKSKYPTNQSLTKIASFRSQDDYLFDKMKCFQFDASNYDIQRALRFNMSYHEVNYIQERITLVSDVRRVSSATKDSFAMDLNLNRSQHNKSTTSKFWTTANNLKDISKNLKLCHKAKKTDYLRKNIQPIKEYLSFPFDPSLKLAKLIVKDCHVLPSVHSPILLTFETNKRCPTKSFEINVEILSLKAPPGVYKVYGIIRGIKLSLDVSTTIQRGHAWIENTMTFIVPSRATSLVLQVTKMSGLLYPRRTEDNVGICWIQLSSLGEMGKKTFYAQLWKDELQPSPTSQRCELEICISKISRRREYPSYERTRLLYKYGDDIRQEHFCLSMFQKMNSILKGNGLDMNLIVFRCTMPSTASKTEGTAGVIEWIDECIPLSTLFGNAQDSNVSSNWYYARQSDNPILNLLRDSNYDPEGPYFISKSVFDTYIKSCAGYCVLTYLLGVGDRHLDNLLVHPDGYFFHCDFSFLFGRDPKAYIPVRFTTGMALAMGGKDSDYYSRFLSLAGAAFLTFRRQENVRMLANSIMCLKECNLPDISAYNTPEEALSGLFSRLKLDLESDDEALSYFEQVIEDSISNKLWIAVDTIHNLGKIV